MALIPPLRRLLQEDFQDQSEWIGKLITPLNDHMERVTRALSKSLTLEENLAARIIDVTVDGVYPVKIAWNLKQRPRTLIVGAVKRADGADFTQTAAIQAQWKFNQKGELQIDTVVGISPSAANKYIITLEVKTG